MAAKNAEKKTKVDENAEKNSATKETEAKKAEPTKEELLAKIS